MTYQVGDLIDFQDDDPVFNTLEEAIIHAHKRSSEFEQEYFGIWDDVANLVAIVHQETVYTP